MTLIGRTIRDFNTTEQGTIRSDAATVLLVNMAGGVRRVDRSRVRLVNGALFIDAPADLGKAIEGVPRKPRTKIPKGNKVQAECAKLGITDEEFARRLRMVGLTCSEYFDSERRGDVA